MILSILTARVQSRFAETLTLSINPNPNPSLTLTLNPNPIPSANREDTQCVQPARPMETKSKQRNDSDGRPLPVLNIIH